MKAKYNATGNYLEELPGMEKPPSPWKYESNSVKELVTREWKLYNEHITSLRRIHCHSSCVGKWSDGQELTEGVEYEVKKHCLQADNCLLSSACITCDDTAFPLPVKSEDDLWEEVIHYLTYNPGLSNNTKISDLKQSFTITKK